MMFASPVLAFEYERLPTGIEIKSPLNLTISFDNTDFVIDSDLNYEKWCFLAYDTNSNYYTSNAVIKTTDPQIGTNLQMTIPINTTIQSVMVQGVMNSDDCSNDTNGIAWIDNIEYSIDGVFTIIETPPTTPTTTPTTTKEQVAIITVLGFMLVFAMSFYLIQKIL